MNFRWNTIANLAALGACCSVAVWIGSTNAKDGETSVVVKKQDATKSSAPADEGPILPPPTKQSAQSGDLFAPRQQAAPNLAKPVPPPTTSTQPRENSTVKRPFMQPAQPREPARGQLTTGDESLPAPAGPPSSVPPARELKVRPAPPIDYDTHHSARRMYRAGQVQMVMVTQDPADGCCYEIPLCIPACCTGEPTISSGHGIFGRGVVEYCWSCGFRAKVKFRHVLGDVKVEYEGD